MSKLKPDHHSGPYSHTTKKASQGCFSITFVFRLPNYTQMATFGGKASRQYPPKIEELLKSMEKAQIRIENLSQQLNTAKSEYTRLKIEWKAYKASIAPIRTCPPEVLSIIFHLYLRENPRLVRRLLLVCKEWYSLVVNDPRMWNRIPVTIPDEWDVESTAVPIERRIKCCLQRSGTLLLELELNLGSLRSAEDTIIEKIRTFLTDDVSAHDLATWDTIYEWSQGLDLDELMTSPLIATTYTPKSIFDIVRQLIGDTGEIMARWGSLKLHLPEPDMQVVMDIWQIFAWPAPNLSRMVIRCSEDMGDYPDELAVGFPDISSLKHLDIFDTESLEFLKLESSSLESLVIYRGVHYWNSIGLARFTQLQRLEVTDLHGNFEHVERFTIHLPKLRHLILNGDVKNLDAVNFRVPVLHALDLVRGGHDGFHPLPKLQSLHVRWETVRTRRILWSPTQLLEEMKRILVQFDNAVKFTINEFARSALMETVQSLYANGELPSALETIVVEELDGEETIPVASLC
jgi:F-box-like